MAIHMMPRLSDTATRTMVKMNIWKKRWKLRSLTSLIAPSSSSLPRYDTEYRLAIRPTKAISSST